MKLLLPLDLAFTFLFPCLIISLSLPWTCPDLVLNWLWHCHNLALTLPRPCLHIAFTLPLKFSQDRVSNSWNIPDLCKCHKNKCCLDKCHHDRCSQETTCKVSSKSGQYQLRYSWYGQMSRGQMLRGQMSPWQLESVLNVQRNLPLKFHQIRGSNSWDIADIEFAVGGGWCWCVVV